MRTVAGIAVCVVLSVACARHAVAGEEPQTGSAATTQQVPATPGDELHFVSLLTLQGDVVAVDQVNGLVTLKGANGDDSTMEARSEKDLEALKASDHVEVHYFEGAQIGKKEREEGVPIPSLNDGIIDAAKKHALIASVATVDAVDQEITLEGSDGSLETIMVSNPQYLRQIKVGDRVVITRAQALALSLKKEAP